MTHQRALILEPSYQLLPCFAATACTPAAKLPFAAVMAVMVCVCLLMIRPAGAHYCLHAHKINHSVPGSITCWLKGPVTTLLRVVMYARLTCRHNTTKHSVQMLNTHARIPISARATAKRPCRLAGQPCKSRSLKAESVQCNVLVRGFN